MPKMKWHVPAYCAVSVLIFAVCWTPIVMGYVTNEAVLTLLGALSGVPFALAIPFVFDHFLTRPTAYQRERDLKDQIGRERMDHLNAMHATIDRIAIPGDELATFRAQMAAIKAWDDAVMGRPSKVEKAS